MSLVDRFKDAIAVIVAELLPNRAFFAPVRYTITKAEAGKFSATPTSDRYPEIAEAPIYGAFAGNAASELVAGSTVLVIFPEGNPADPVLLAILDTPTTLALESTDDTTLTVGGVFKVNGASDFVALAGLVATELEAIKTAYDAHVHPTGVGPSGPPAAPLTAPSSTACTKIKTD